MRTARLLQKCIRKERIIPYQRGAADGCLQDLREFCVDSVRKGNRPRRKLTGSVIHAERNGRHKKSGSYVDGFHADRQEMFRLPSAAGEKFFCRRIPASVVCQMHRNCDRTCGRYRSITIPFYTILEPDRNAASYG